jgi:formylglycine-generating enzyme required for sulfatase activity
MLILTGLLGGVGAFAPAADAPRASEATENSVGMKLALIPEGEFDMGSPADEKGRQYDETQHKVQITKAFRIGVTEVTQKQWQTVMGAPRGQFPGEDRPVEKVSWKEAAAFCQKLSETESAKAGKPVVYRLPTEAEWEYACRAGSKAPFAGTGNEDDMAWYSDNSEEQTHPVAQKKPNACGLFDMHGNVAEWCADYYQPEYDLKQTADPKGPAEGKERVGRGGAWDGCARRARCAARTTGRESYQQATVGFRVVMEVEP